MFRNSADQLQDIVARIERDIFEIKYNIEQGRTSWAMFDMENLIATARETFAEAMKDFRAEKKASPVYRLAHDINALYDDMDPYCTAREYGESDAHYLLRMSAGCDVDDIRESLADLDEMADGDQDLQRKLAGFRRRLSKITG